jgi:hypothetical protein
MMKVVESLSRLPFGTSTEILNQLEADGFTIVPKEPTDAQVINALDWALEWMRQHKVDGLSPFKDYPPVRETTKGMYRAMILAANQ